MIPPFALQVNHQLVCMLLCSFTSFKFTLSPLIFYFNSEWSCHLWQKVEKEPFLFMKLLKEFLPAASYNALLRVQCSQTWSWGSSAHSQENDLHQNKKWKGATKVAKEKERENWEKMKDTKSEKSEKKWMRLKKARNWGQNSQTSLTRAAKEAGATFTRDMHKATLAH
jgi:hypothetical protein